MANNSEYEVWEVVEELIGKQFRSKEPIVLYKGSYDGANGFWLGYLEAKDLDGRTVRFSARDGYASYSWEGARFRVRLRPVR